MSLNLVIGYHKSQEVGGTRPAGRLSSFVRAFHALLDNNAGRGGLVLCAPVRLHTGRVTRALSALTAARRLRAKSNCFVTKVDICNRHCQNLTEGIKVKCRSNAGICYHSNRTANIENIPNNFKMYMYNYKV